MILKINIIQIIILRKIWYDEKKEKLIDNYTNKIINQFPTLIINDLNDNTIILTYDKFLSEFISLAVCFVNSWNEIRLRGKFINIQNENENNNIAISKYYYSIIWKTNKFYN